MHAYLIWSSTLCYIIYVCFKIDSYKNIVTEVDICGNIYTHNLILFKLFS